MPSLQSLQAIAADNQWMAIFPELMLGCLALALLVLEIVLPKSQHRLIPGVAIAGQIALLVGFVVTGFNSGYIGSTTFNGLLYHSSVGQFMRAFFLLTSIGVSLLGVIALARQKMPRTEFYLIVMVVSGAMMLLAQSNNFVMLFVSLETVTVGFYVLVSYFRTSSLSLEAGLKYLILGALSSSLLLFGIVLLYGVAGNPLLPMHTANAMSFTELQLFLAANPNNFLASVGIVLVLSGIAFKIGSFPFQIWIPDVYQGAPTPVTAFLAIGSKAAGFAVLMALVHQAFAPYQALVVPILAATAAATLLFGNFAALTQHNVKRLLGLSGVSHAGFLLLGVVASFYTEMAVGAILFYLVVYLVASFAVFGVMSYMAGSNDADQELDHYAGLSRENPLLAGVLAVGLGSLAGIPPLAGFMGKLFIFISVVKAGYYWLLAVAIVGVIVSIYYYFGWIKAAFFDGARLPLVPGEKDTRPARTEVGAFASVTLCALALFTLLLGFYQGSFGAWFGR